MLTGYRVYLAAALVSVFGFLATTDWVAILHNPEAGWVGVVTGALMAAARAITAAFANPPVE